MDDPTLVQAASHTNGTSIMGLSTHLDASAGFPYETAIAAVSIFFFRVTCKLYPLEPERFLFAALLAALVVLSPSSYELVVAVELFSYVVPVVLRMPSSSSPNNGPLRRQQSTLARLWYMASGAAGSLLLAHLGATGQLWDALCQVTPRAITQLLAYLFPVEEMRQAYEAMQALSLEPAVYRKMIQHLFFVTFHIQVGMGYLGINFLRSEQLRRNELIRLDLRNDSDEEKDILERSKRFQRGAAPFIFITAFPYMIQIITLGNINKFAFSCVADEMHRVVRFRQVFEHDNHLTAIANDSAVSPSAYAGSMNAVITTTYDIFNRKLFSLPKVLLLPRVMARQPMLLVQVFPFIFLSDWIKATIVSFLTTQIENLKKEVQDLTAIRTKVESFDIKNAELLQRSGRGATQFTQQRWEELTVKVQAREVVGLLLGRSKDFFSFMQRNFVFTVLIDCALANLIAIGKISTGEIFVFSRAIEDAVDMVLMRSRNEAELARMMTEIERLDKLNTLLEGSKKANLLRCAIENGSGRTAGHRHINSLVLRNLHYNRGTATARADHIELKEGVYALTGSNGSGKSTLFRILMSCHTNAKSIDLPTSINLLTPAEPLTEEDDILREKACLAGIDEEADADDSCDSDDLSKRQLQNKEGMSTYEVPSDMPHHIPKLSITMPSKHVVEISQNFYWPLYSKPIDWIFQDHFSETMSDVELQKLVRTVAEELHSLEFFQATRSPDDDLAIFDSDQREVSVATSAEDTIQRIMAELQMLKEDWFSDLSGGQKSKVELVRAVFLSKKCPDVLLIDETMAPLDPASKELVMAKLKMFCSESIIIVIYHTDVGQGKEIEGKHVDCVPSNHFFDKNIHLDKGIVHVRETC